MKAVLLLLAVVLVAAACTSTASSPVSSDPSPTPESESSLADTPTPTPVRESSPALPHITVVDTSKASVPLDRIIFDTFDGGSVRLTNATDELLLRLRNAIPPLNNPKYDPADSVTYLKPDALVIGYSAGNEHYAYPFQILNFHEFVNDELGGVPVLVSYCPLCRSGIVFDRRVEGRTLTFGNTSALYESNAVAFDNETGSYWFQAAGEAIVGPLTGARLKPLPSVVTTWAEWKTLHPDTLVLSADTGLRARYDIDPFDGLDDRIEDRGFVFPVSEEHQDTRLPLADHVLAVKVDGMAKAYPLDTLGDAVVNDTLNSQAIVIFSLASGPSGAAYLSTLDGQKLTFSFRDGRYVDDETGSTWNLAGEATAGPMLGVMLEPVPTLFSFWFTVSTIYPEIEIYST